MPTSYPPDKKTPSSSSHLAFQDHASTAPNISADVPPSYHDATKFSDSTEPSSSTRPYHSSAAGPLTRPPNQPPHLLHVYRDSLLNKNLTIMAPDKTTIAYTATANVSSIISAVPHISIHRGPALLPPPPPTSSSSHHQQPLPTPIVGTMKFHAYTQSIDLTLHNQPARLETDGPLLGLITTSLGYNSPAMGTRLVWQRLHGKMGMAVSLEMVLVTSRGDTLARWESRTSIDKRGVLEIVGYGLGGEVLDEIVTTAVAVSEWHKRRR